MAHNEGLIRAGARKRGRRWDRPEVALPAEVKDVVRRRGRKIVIDLAKGLPDLREIRVEIEREIFREAIRRTEGNVTRAGKMVGIVNQGTANKLFRFLNGEAESRSRMTKRSDT